MAETGPSTELGEARLTWSLEESLQGLYIDAAIICQLILPIGHAPIHEAANAFHPPDAQHLFQRVIGPVRLPHGKAHIAFQM